MPIIKSLIELAIAPFMFIPMVAIKLIEHQKMVDEMNTNRNQ